MATTTFTAHNDDGAAEADFNQMGAALSGALSTVGLIKVSGPTWGALTLASNPTEVWRFNDTLQATQPVYIKIEYTYTNGFNITVGRDSSFTLNTPRMQVQGGTVQANLENCYASGATNRIVVAMWQGPDTYSGCVFNVERTKDGTGADTSAGIIVQACSPAGNFNFVIPFNTSLVFAGYNAYFISAWNRGSNTQNYGANVIGSNPITPFNFIPYNPGLGLLMFMATDFAQLSTQQINMYGTVHTYQALQNMPSTITNPNGTMNLLMRWE